MQIRALNYWQCEVSLRPCCLRGGIYNNVQKMRRAINNIMTLFLQPILLVRAKVQMFSLFMIHLLRQETKMKKELLGFFIV